MSAAARQVAKQLLRYDAPSLARGFKSSAGPKYHYVSAKEAEQRPR
jgi:hypothetical protein